MSAGMEQIRAQMAEHLNSHGVVAVTAWPDSGRTEEGRVVAVVSLRGCQVGPAGFQNYLGERYDQETGLWQERYGRRARLTFGLDLYAPKQGSGQQVQIIRKQRRREHQIEFHGSAFECIICLRRQDIYRFLLCGTRECENRTVGFPHEAVHFSIDADGP